MHSDDNQSQMEINFELRRIVGRIHRRYVMVRAEPGPVLVVGTDHGALARIRARFSDDVSDHVGYGGGGASWWDEGIVQFLGEAIAAGIVYDVAKTSVSSVVRWRRLARFARNDFGAFTLDDRTAEAFARWFIMESYVQWEHVPRSSLDPLEWRVQLHSVSYQSPTWFLELDDPHTLMRFMVEVTDCPGLPLLALIKREQIPQEMIHMVPTVKPETFLVLRSWRQRGIAIVKAVVSRLRN